MIDRLSERLADAFIGSGAAKEDDRDIYVYGLDVLLSTAVNILCILAIGVILGRALQTVAFLVFFSLLRSTAGGYHANTHFRCFLVMLFVFSGAMVLLVLVPAAPLRWLCYAAVFAALAAVVALAPAPHINRPVSKADAVKFRRLSLALSLAEAAASLLCLALGAVELGAAAALGLLASSGSLCAACFAGHIRQNSVPEAK